MNQFWEVCQWGFSTGCYDTKLAVRAEDKIEQLKITGLALGTGVVERIHFHGGDPGRGFEDNGGDEAPPLHALLQNGFPAR